MKVGRSAIAIRCRTPRVTGPSPPQPCVRHKRRGRHTLMARVDIQRDRDEARVDIQRDGDCVGPSRFCCSEAGLGCVLWTSLFQPQTETSSEMASWRGSGVGPAQPGCGKTCGRGGGSLRHPGARPFCSERFLLAGRLFPRGGCRGPAIIGSVSAAGCHAATRSRFALALRDNVGGSFTSGHLTARCDPCCRRPCR